VRQPTDENCKQERLIIIITSA